MPGLFDLNQQQPSGLLANLQRNMPYLQDQNRMSYTTQLSPIDEFAFRNWVKQNNVPFNPNQQINDYDMRGFYQALMQGNPRASSGINPNDQQLHFSDYWKTPFHETFSNESQFANQMAPQWNTQDQLISPQMRILFDEKAR